MTDVIAGTTLMSSLPPVPCHTASSGPCPKPFLALKAPVPCHSWQSWYLSLIIPGTPGNFPVSSLALFPTLVPSGTSGTPDTCPWSSLALLALVLCHPFPDMESFTDAKTLIV